MGGITLFKLCSKLFKCIKNRFSDDVVDPGAGQDVLDNAAKITQNSGGAPSSLPGGPT